VEIFFQAKRDERSIIIMTAGLWREADVCSAPLIFARRVGGIDSIAESHWTINFRRFSFADPQENSENDDIPHIGGR
jgi:hypothetical protein